MKRPTLVLMAGLPGVGKSQLACQLGKASQWTVIDKDTIKDMILENRFRNNIPYDDDEVASLAYNISFQLIHKLLILEHQSIILDSSMLHQSIFEKTVQLAREADAHLKIILCFCDEDIRQQRMRTRKIRPSQIYCQRVHKESILYIEQYIATIDTKVLKICTNDNFAEYIYKAQTYVTDTCITRHSRTFSKFKQRIKYFLSHLGYNIFIYGTFINPGIPCYTAVV